MKLLNIKRYYKVSLILTWFCSGKRRSGQAGSRGSREGTWCPVASIAYLKLRISEKFRSAKEAWHKDPKNHGTEEISPPPPKKSCMDKAKNSIARTAAQIRTGHWRSAVFLKRIRKRTDNNCWFCKGPKMTRSHVLLHCTNAKLRAAREEAWEEKTREASESFSPTPGGSDAC